MIYTYTIMGNPKSKKNNMRPARRKNGSLMLIQSQTYIDYANDAMPQLLEQLQQQHHDAIDTAVNVQMIYYRSDRRRTDLVNLQNATLDILVQANILADDNYNIVASMDGSRVYYDKDNPRTEITITPAVLSAPAEQPQGGADND